MHEAVHVAVLVSTLCGAAAVALVLLWPVMAERPLPRSTRALMGVLIGLAVASLVVEWVAIH